MADTLEDYGIRKAYSICVRDSRGNLQPVTGYEELRSLEVAQDWYQRHFKSNKSFIITERYVSDRRPV